jgi:hypothetical protein
MNAESPTPTSGAYVWLAYPGWATSLDIAARGVRGVDVRKAASSRFDGSP